MKYSTPHRLVFTEKQKVELESFELPGLESDEVLVRTERSLMSTGTENIVFNRLFDPGTHWDRWVKYPFYPGYASSGVVEAVGEGVDTHKPGDRVAWRARHRSHMVMKADEVYPMPDSVSFEDAPWFALAKIAFNGAYMANYKLGEDVVIIGAGPIGQMTLRWARAAGARRPIVIDPVPQREKMAINGGASAYLTMPADQALEKVKEILGGKQPEVVIDTTGHEAVFPSALALVADMGRVIVLGDTGRPTKQCLTSDVIKRGVHIIGAHDCFQFPEWTQGTIAELFFGMIVDGRINLEGINTHLFEPENCMSAYGIANSDRANTMGIQFNWAD
ncbi:zinc-binding alcohol dehydrogenase [Ruficoccus sp. ZRK36]|uniref:zinc-dependent alcohol dehydrogenase n=1 Tax=Ruficoccus sp. ZRK36 TaxID=2866311 RepID=UPI001C72C84C|nr:zinc-binding alcohol dehydrogenase [Ruficoccus sp. ZRK36]QYY34833.1 zinc-binding alcohol dehydrogenase [Ruficoccus sp. ZRK36]